MRNRFSAVVALVCLAACARVGFAADAPGQELVGRVTRVVDGDTLELSVSDERPIRIRLAQIDAPEKAQPYGKQATIALSSIALGKQVRVEVIDIDRYGRAVGEIFLLQGSLEEQDRHVNTRMVRHGHAWAYTRYAKSVAIIELEDEARRDERGLWKLPVAQRDPPWEWRRSRDGRQASRPSDARPDTSCGAKRTCKEMVSCAEARFYLSQCGLTRLDGDRDGVPCESKCRE